MHIFLKALILVLLSFSSLNCVAFDMQNTQLEQNYATISNHSNNSEISKQNNQNITISSNRNELSINVLRRSQNTTPNTLDGNFLTYINKQNINIIKSITSKKYFDKESNIALLPLLYQIQPNAP